MFNINLNRDGRENLYTQIYEAIRAEILADKYTPDTKMPSIRALASRLNVNPDTVVKAYDLLAAENLIYKKEGSGSYIAPAAASKRNNDDQRLRILSSKTYLAPTQIFDLSGMAGGQEIVEEYSWDLIFDRFFTKFKAKSFASRKIAASPYFKLLSARHQDLAKNKFYYSSQAQLREILSEFIDFEQEILVTKDSNYSLFLEILKKEADNISTAEFLSKKDEIKVTEADYETLMDYLEANDIKYLIITDEYLNQNVLDWSLSKLKSLLELAQMLRFKLVIFENFSLYQENEKIKELLKSKFAEEIILIQSLGAKVFPGLEVGLVYAGQKDNRAEQKLTGAVEKYLFSSIKEKRNFASGENLVNNMWDYYLEESYLEKRIKFLKQRLKNKKLLMEEAVKEHFRGVKLMADSSLFYLRLKLREPLDQQVFKIFAEKKSILLPDYNNFFKERENDELIISPAALNQFSIKQSIMMLAKVYRDFQS